MPQENDELLTAEQEFDSAWSDGDDHTDYDDESEGDTSDEAASDDIEDDDSVAEEANTDDSDDSTDDKSDPSNKDEQRYKSWEGRLKADEARLKKEREEWEAQRNAPPAEENQNEDEQDTEDGPDEFEDEFPEVADYLKKKIAPIHQQLTQSQQEQQRKATEAHFSRITASHPDAIDVANSEDFKAWIEEQPYKKATEYVKVQQSGTAEQVIAMLDDFKQTSKNHSANSQKMPSGVVKTRRTAKPRGRVSVDDFDGAWDEAIQK
ncbi:hypothetical protein EBI00_02490 [Marinomonas hwangdonensis]|uniref:Uncharacterized protein n=1 Tax=Marinomonas hwangdonensis TaxID=1053647 RepID=A0A3M8QA91_9GAMM|nr:hypothetical protein [Marinomonas hwangdonensis]RNF52988.1 hypothetical protein EBI00_02490 [Marinomonas hwangdonensis]